MWTKINSKNDEPKSAGMYLLTVENTEDNKATRSTVLGVYRKVGTEFLWAIREDNSADVYRHAERMTWEDEGVSYSQTIIAWDYLPSPLVG